MTPSTPLAAVKEDFIAQWAALGQAWGISRTMAQIQALLLVSEEPLNTDQIMDALAASRGNVHANLKELMSWDLARKVVLKGDRKEYFVGEKDPWAIFCKVARERKRREIEPLHAALTRISADLDTHEDAEAAALKKRVAELAEFADLGDRVLDRIARSEKSRITRWLLQML